MKVHILLIIFVPIICILGGFALGVFITQRQTKKMMLDNPPLNEEAICMMMSNMGRKPSETQVQQTLRQIRGAAKAQANTKKKK